MNRAAVYIRTTPLSEEPDARLRHLNQVAKDRGIEVVAACPEKVWRADTRRPVLNDLLCRARKGEFETVLVYSLVDVARNLKHCLEVVRELNSVGVRVIAYQDGIEISAEPDSTVARIVAAFCEVHRSLVSEAVRAGMRRSQLDGIRLGRRPVEVNRSAILGDRASGMSFSAIGKKHGVSKAMAFKIIAEARNHPRDTVADLLYRKRCPAEAVFHDPSQSLGTV